MKTRVRKWGNGLALPIPRSFAAEAQLSEDTPVELTLVDGKLIVQPLTPKPPTLDELLRGITDDNLHGEWDTGPAVGREVRNDRTEEEVISSRLEHIDHQSPEQCHSKKN